MQYWQLFNTRNNRKWDKQGVIVEVLNNHRYRIKVKGSGPITLRNRQFIKPCSLIQPNTTITASRAPNHEHQQIPVVISPVTLPQPAAISVHTLQQRNHPYHTRVNNPTLTHLLQRVRPEILPHPVQEV